MKKHIRSITRVLLPMLLFSSCKKEFDTPPLRSAAAANKINIANMKAKYSPGVNYKFKADSSLYCVVTADEASGNLYKEIYVKDITGALHVKFLASGGFFIGDSIRIDLRGTILNEYNKLIQLDSVDSENNIVKLASGYKPTPAVMTINQINTAASTATNGVQAKLVKIDNVEFVEPDRNVTYADANGRSSLSRTIRSCDGQTLAIRTSGYASFADRLTPSGNGSIVGIVSQFGNSMQMIVRNADEVLLYGNVCTTTPTTPPAGNTYVLKDFNDNSLTSGGWTSYTVTNNAVKWVTSTFSGATFAKVSGYVNSANTISESWLISPALDLSSATDPMLSFQTAAGKFSGDPLEVMVSVNYSGGLPGSASWTKLSCSLSPTTSSYIWTPSGEVPLNSYKNAATRIAFKYVSSTTGAATYELDDVVIKEKQGHKKSGTVDPLYKIVQTIYPNSTFLDSVRISSVICSVAPSAYTRNTGSVPLARIIIQVLSSKKNL